MVKVNNKLLYYCDNDLDIYKKYSDELMIDYIEQIKRIKDIIETFIEIDHVITYQTELISTPEPLIRLHILKIRTCVHKISSQFIYINDIEENKILEICDKILKIKKTNVDMTPYLYLLQELFDCDIMDYI
jgi:hypothetical protein